MAALARISERLVDVHERGLGIAEHPQSDELIALADEKDVLLWKAFGMLGRGWLLGLTAGASDGVQMITSGITAWRATGSTFFLPTWLSCLAGAHGALCQLDQAWRCIGEAMNMIEASKERWFEADANRIAGGIALKSPEPDVAKAQDYFERACCRAETACKIMGTARCNEHGAALARSGQAELASFSLPCTARLPKGSTRDLKEAQRYSTS